MSKPELQAALLEIGNIRRALVKRECELDEWSNNLDAQKRIQAATKTEILCETEELNATRRALQSKSRAEMERLHDTIEILRKEKVVLKNNLDDTEKRLEAKDAENRKLKRTVSIQKLKPQKTKENVEQVDAVSQTHKKSNVCNRTQNNGLLILIMNLFTELFSNNSLATIISQDKNGRLVDWILLISRKLATFWRNSDLDQESIKSSVILAISLFDYITQSEEINDHVRHAITRMFLSAKKLDYNNAKLKLAIYLKDSLISKSINTSEIMDALKEYGELSPADHVDDHETLNLLMLSSKRFSNKHVLLLITQVMTKILSRSACIMDKIKKDQIESVTKHYTEHDKLLGETYKSALIQLINTASVQTEMKKWLQILSK